MVPITCFLSPWARAGSVIRTASRSIVQRSFMFLAPSNSVIAQCVPDIQSGAGRKKSKRDSFPTGSEPSVASLGMTNSRKPRSVAPVSPSVVVLLGLGRRLGSVQEVVFFLLFLAVVGTFWIVFFHFEFFCRSERGQMTDEAHQFPAIFDIVIVFGSSAAKRGHSGKAHAVLDDPENVAVRKLLRLVSAKIGWLGIQSMAKHGIAAAVVAMADGAVIGEVQTSLALNFRRIGKRIFRVVRTGRGGHFPRGTGNSGFKSAGRGAGAQAVMQYADCGR